MKKKLIIGALGLASVLAFAQTTEDDSSSETSGKFFGTQCGRVTFNNGSPQVSCCYYVFWVNTGCHIEQL